MKTQISLQNSLTKMLTIICLSFLAIILCSQLFISPASANPIVTIDLEDAASGTGGVGSNVGGGGSGTIGGGNSGGGGGGGGGGLPTGQKQVFFPCTTVGDDGNCFIDQYVYEEKVKKTQISCTFNKSYQLWKGGKKIDEGLVGDKQSGVDVAYHWIWKNDYFGGFEMQLWLSQGAKSVPHTAGAYTFLYGTTGNCEPVYMYFMSMQKENTTCAPHGPNTVYPFAVGITVTYTKQQEAHLTGWNHVRQNCVYLRASTPPTPVYDYTAECFYNPTYSLYYNTNRSTIGNGGNRIAGPHTSAHPPRASINGDKTGLVNCFSDLTNSWQAPLQDYGYYKIHGAWKVDKFAHYKWPAWTKNPRVADIRLAGTENRDKANFYSYSCHNDGSAIESWGSNAGNMPDRNQYFNAAACPQTSWRCEIQSPTALGIDVNTLPPGSTSVNREVFVMRNGEKIPLTFSRLGVIDTTNGNRVDVTNGGGGPTVRNVSNIRFQDLVKQGSSPFYGNNPNVSGQYFELFKSMAGTSTPWGTWDSHANSNREKAIAFRWSTDDANGSFVAQRQWQVNGEFYVPRQGVIDTNNPNASFHYEWVSGTENCYEYDGSGNKTGNLLTANSNPTKVVRSVNK